MRKSFIKLLFVAWLPVLFLSCIKETNDNLDQQEKYYLNNPEAISQVKFIHAYTPLTLGGTPAQSTTTMGFRITMDGNKINGAGNASVTTNTFMYGGTYPATTAYAFLPPGSRNFRFVMNRVSGGAFVPVTGDEYLSTTVALAPGKRYSMFIADPYTTGYLIEDNFIRPGLDGYGIRFVNLCADAASRFDVFSIKNGLKLFSDVGYKEMRDYIYLGTVPNDTILLRNAGTTTVISQINGFTPGSQRVYTLYARGKTGVAGRAPSLSFYTNR